MKKLWLAKRGERKRWKTSRGIRILKKIGVGRKVKGEAVAQAEAQAEGEGKREKGEEKSETEAEVDGKEREK